MFFILGNEEPDAYDNVPLPTLFSGQDEKNQTKMGEWDRTEMMTLDLT